MEWLFLFVFCLLEEKEVSYAFFEGFGFGFFGVGILMSMTPSLNSDMLFRTEVCWLYLELLGEEERLELEDIVFFNF